MGFEQAADGELEWRQAERRFYQLISSGQEIASLRFAKACGSLASGACGDRRWTFKRTGFLSPRITVRAEGSETTIAEFTPNWHGGGWVVFDSGRRYQLRNTNFWATACAFEGPDGAAAVTLSAHAGLFKQSGVIEVARSAAALPEAPVLALLVWYVRLLANDDAGAVALIAAAG
jgi:hypothetical protein